LGPIALALVKRNTPVDAQLLVEGVAASQEILVEAYREIYWAAYCCWLCLRCDHVGCS